MWPRNGQYWWGRCRSDAWRGVRSQRRANPQGLPPSSAQSSITSPSTAASSTMTLQRRTASKADPRKRMFPRLTNSNYDHHSFSHPSPLKIHTDLQFQLRSRSLRAVLFWDHFLYFLYVVSQHLLNSALQGGTGGWTTSTCTHHLHPQHSRSLVKGEKANVPTVLLNIGPDSVSDDLLDELHHFRVIRVDVIALCIKAFIHKEAFSVRRGIF